MHAPVIWPALLLKEELTATLMACNYLKTEGALPP